MFVYESLHTFLCIFKNSLYFPVGTVSSCILDHITVRFFLLLSGIVFYVFRLGSVPSVFEFAATLFSIKTR